jgi:hypothetical protein
MKKLSYRAFARKLKLLPKKTKINPDRQSRFAWSDNDVEHHPPKKKVNEKTFEKPVMEPHFGDEWHASNSNTDRDHVNQFKSHAKALEDAHKKSPRDSVVHSINRYKGNAYVHINNHLRGKPHESWATHEDKDGIPTHVKNLDHATNHPIKHEMHVYRGIDPENSNFHNLKPDHEFTDHGYTSASMDHHIARHFGASDKDHSDDDSEPEHHVMKIHLPKGTKAHHFDAHDNMLASEKEVVLHRGTRFKVSHHSHDPRTNTHYVHVTAVHQEDHK